MTRTLTLPQMADLIREQAVEATAEKLGMSPPDVACALRARNEQVLNTFCEFVTAGSKAAERLHDLGLLAIA
ncbi:hypothetical protein AB4Z48_18200 [Cupriavidus sp. 2TAF22]|uniref:hypothetical protein n=1 Tax=unclassified Cupriavidus TaxID=2640874 RepID=UPI003F8E46C6